MIFSLQCVVSLITCVFPEEPLIPMNLINREMTTPTASVLVGLSGCSRVPLCILLSNQGLLFSTRKIHQARLLFKTLKQASILLSPVAIFYEAQCHYQKGVGALLEV